MDKNDFVLVEFSQVINVCLGMCSYRTFHAGVKVYNAREVVAASHDGQTFKHFTRGHVPGIDMLHDAKIEGRLIRISLNNVVWHTG
jgi:hypothetical protein